MQEGKEAELLNACWNRDLVQKSSSPEFQLLRLGDGRAPMRVGFMRQSCHDGSDYRKPVIAYELMHYFVYLYNNNLQTVQGSKTIILTKYILYKARSKPNGCRYDR